MVEELNLIVTRMLVNYTDGHTFTHPLLYG